LKSSAAKFKIHVCCFLKAFKISSMFWGSAERQRGVIGPKDGVVVEGDGLFCMGDPLFFEFAK
jgi:hypothetical protein